MRYWLFFVTLIATEFAFSQQKGVTPLPPSYPLTGSLSVTRAVVVGISDYQDKDIPDLKYAHKDAEAFANFLRSPAGGSLDDEHLKVLLNSEATVAQFAIALDWLMENSKEGDNAIIYFSGHGDVEKKTLTQPGFLLCWDAPSRVYMAGGAFALPMLQEVISTLSIQNKAKVVVITDACRSGTLAGHSIGGAQATAANLAKQYANEIKILSCQPNEYSIEGEQWGGGRGAFSFNLVDALYGMADGNGDLFVTLQEVGRYLEDHVTAEVAPVSQVPMVLGNRTERLAAVDAQLLADLRAGRASQMKMLSPVETRGMEDDVLAGVDTTTRELYRLFKKALKDKVFLEPAQACADVYYARLMAEAGMVRLHSTMTRNYAAALQDDAQQVLNIMLKSGLTSEVLSDENAAHIYRNYPAYLDRAAELLGRGHYMYAALKARKHYFKGTLQTEKAEKKQQLFQALHWQEDMPHAYASLINQYPAEQADSAEYYAARAMQIVPAWVKPYINLSRFYQHAMLPDKAEELLSRALQVDSSSILVYYEKARFYTSQKKYDAAEHWYLKAIAGAGTDICFPCAYNNLANLYLNARRYAEAEQQCKKAIQLDSAFAPAYSKLGNAYLNTRRYAEAEQQCKKAIQLDSTYAFAYRNLAWLYSLQNQTDKAYEQLEQALKKGLSTFDYLQQDEYLAPLREQKQRWNTLMQNAIVPDTMDAKAWNLLGQVYIGARNYAPAEAAMGKAVALDATNAPFRSNLGFIYLNLGRYPEAEAALTKAAALDSAFANARKHLGMVCFKTNRPDEARQNFLQAIALDPNYAPAMLGMAYLLFSEGKTEEALGYVGQAISKGSTYEQLESDEYLAPLRAQKERWEALMKKYFPDKVKD